MNKFGGKLCDYAESGTVGEELLKEIASPMIPEEQYAQIVNGTVN